MKTAISLPDALFEQAEQVAERLGLTRSELYARAIARFVREHSGESITQAIDTALRAASDEGLDPSLARLQAASLGPDEGSFEDWVAPPSSRTGAKGGGTSKAGESKAKTGKRGRRG